MTCPSCGVANPRGSRFCKTCGTKLDFQSEAQTEYETTVIQKIPEIDKQAADLYAKSPVKAREFLTKFCLDNAQKVVAGWWELGDKLLVKYNHFGFYDSEKRTRGRGKPAPAIWQKAVKLADVLAETEK